MNKKEFKKFEIIFWSVLILAAILLASTWNNNKQIDFDEVKKAHQRAQERFR